MQESRSYSVQLELLQQLKAGICGEQKVHLLRFILGQKDLTTGQLQVVKQLLQSRYEAQQSSGEPQKGQQRNFYSLPFRSY